MTKRSRVALIDDHPLVLVGLRSLLRATSDFELAGEALDGPAGVRMVRETRPDIAVVDLSMPGLSGINLVEELTRQCPATKPLVLTIHEDETYAQQLLLAGARGYVLKRAAADDIVRALRAVAAGGVHIDPLIAARMLKVARPTLVGHQLSERESDVARLAARGLTNKEIALSLRLSVKTVEAYRARAMGKLGLRSRAELVRYGLVNGWIAGT